MKKETFRNDFTSSLTFAGHLIESSRMLLDKLELENKTDKRLIRQKRNSINTYDRLRYYAAKYVSHLESILFSEAKQNQQQKQTTSSWRDEYDMSDPNQREAARCLQASLVREKWPELF